MGKFPYEEPVEPNSVGMNGRKLNQAVSKFRNQNSSGVFPGGQLVVRRQGKLVINEVCGVGRGWRKEEGITPLQVQPDTPFVGLSAGKPIAAVAIAILEERGVLEAETPIAEWIPGFEIYGKGDITILDVLTHRTGLELPDLIASREIWHDREALLHQLIEAKPTRGRANHFTLCNKKIINISGNNAFVNDCRTSK